MFVWIYRSVVVWVIIDGKTDVVFRFRLSDGVAARKAMGVIDISNNHIVDIIIIRFTIMSKLDFCKNFYHLQL